MPDASDCFIQGGTPGVSHDAGLPNIKGACSIAEQIQDFKGAFYNLGQSWAHASGYSGGSPGLGFDASRSNPIYSDNVDTVQPKSIEMIYCIRY